MANKLNSNKLNTASTAQQSRLYSMVQNKESIGNITQFK